MLITLTLDTENPIDREILDMAIRGPQSEQQPVADAPVATLPAAAVPPVAVPTPPSPVAAAPPVAPAAGLVASTAPPTQPAAAVPPMPPPQSTVVDHPREVIHQELIVASAQAFAERPQEFQQLAAELRGKFGSESNSWTTEQLKEAVTRTQALLTL